MKSRRHPALIGPKRMQKGFPQGEAMWILAAEAISVQQEQGYAVGMPCYCILQEVEGQYPINRRFRKQWGGYVAAMVDAYLKGEDF